MDVNQLLRALGLQQAYQTYQQNVGQPFANIAGPFGRGLLGLEKPEYGEEQAYRTGQAMGNMPAVSAPAGLLKAAAQTPELLGLLGTVVGQKKLGNIFDMLQSGKGYEFNEAGELITAPQKTIAFGNPSDFRMSRTSDGKKLELDVQKNEMFGDNFYTGNYFVDPGFPKGTGQLSDMYLEAMGVAKRTGSGWVSDPIRSNSANRLYERLIDAGVPFQLVGSGRGQYMIEADELRKVDLEKVAEQLAKRNKPQQQ